MRFLFELGVFEALVEVVKYEIWDTAGQDRHEHCRLTKIDKVSISFSSDLVTFSGAIQKPCSNVLSLAGFMFGSPERVCS